MYGYGELAEMFPLGLNGEAVRFGSSTFNYDGKVPDATKCERKEGTIDAIPGYVRGKGSRKACMWLTCV